jgi:hypothetical protein
MAAEFIILWHQLFYIDQPFPTANLPNGGETASTGIKKRWLHAECSSAR